MEYPKYLISIYRKKIYDFLKDYEGVPVVIEGIPSDILLKILFNKPQSSGRYIFSSEISKIIEKIDFRNVSFDNFDVGGIDFSKLKNVAINPDNIKFPITGFCNFSNVYFTKDINITDSLDYVSFKGSHNAKLKVNPLSHSLSFTGNDFCDATFNSTIVAPLKISYCNFEGSHGAIISLNKVYIFGTILYDAIIYGKLDSCKHKDITPSIKEIKRVYGDLTQPTLIRRKDFN